MTNVGRARRSLHSPASSSSARKKPSSGSSSSKKAGSRRSPTIPSPSTETVSRNRKKSSSTDAVAAAKMEAIARAEMVARRELRRMRRELNAQQVHLEAAQCEAQSLYIELMDSEQRETEAVARAEALQVKALLAMQCTRAPPPPVLPSCHPSPLSRQGWYG